MPHIIVEYSENLLDAAEINIMLKAIHCSIADSGLFKGNQIKTRAYPFKEFTNAGESEPYIHIQARIKSGRDIDNKKRFSEVILSGFEVLSIQTSVITVEVIDMERESYGKYVPVQGK